MGFTAEAPSQHRLGAYSRMLVSNRRQRQGLQPSSRYEVQVTRAGGQITLHTNLTWEPLQCECLAGQAQGAVNRIADEVAKEGITIFINNGKAGSDGEEQAIDESGTLSITVMGEKGVLELRLRTVLDQVATEYPDEQFGRDAKAWWADQIAGLAALRLGRKKDG